MAGLREEIVAFLRVRDATRFKATLKSAGRSVNQLGDEAKRTSREFKKMSRAMAINSVTSAALKDRMSLTRGEIMTTAITIGAYLLPALIAMGGSFAEATLGAATLGTAGLAVLTTGLLGAVLMMKTAVGQFKKIQTAQDAYNLAVAQYGVGSLEAARASGKLYAVIQQNGGVQVWNAVKAVKALGTEWRKLSAPGRKDIFRVLTAGIGGARRLLPTFARESNRNIASLRSNVSGWIRELSGGEMRQNIRSFSQSFRQVSGHTGQGFVNLFIVLGRVLREILPTLRIISIRFERFTMDLRRWSSDPSNVSRFVQQIVGHFWSWWRLLKAIGNTLRIVFGGSAKQGQRLTDVLATQVENLNIWLERMRRTGEMRKFFDMFINTIEDLGSSVGRAWRFFVGVGQAVGFVVGVMSSLGISVGDLAAAFVAYKVAQILATGAAMIWNTTLKVMTGLIYLTRGAIVLMNLALAGSPIFWIPLAIIAVATAFYLLYTRVKLFHDAVDAAINFVKEHWKILIALIPGIGPALSLVITHFQEIKDFVGGVIHFIAQRFRDLIGFIKRIPHAIGGKALGILNKVGSFASKAAGLGLGMLPGHASGGIIPTGTAGLVGERGLELAAAGPSGTMITPLTNTAPNLGLRSQAPLLSVSDMLPPVHVHVQVDKREIGKAYVDWRGQENARKGKR